jgi:hypothetical protein
MMEVSFATESHRVHGYLVAPSGLRSSVDLPSSQPPTLSCVPVLMVRHTLHMDSSLGRSLDRSRSSCWEDGLRQARSPPSVKAPPAAALVPIPEAVGDDLSETVQNSVIQVRSRANTSMPAVPPGRSARVM